MIRVCFVCTGNICRSPTAEAILRALDSEGLLHIESAGLVSHHVGQAADPRSQQAAMRRGYELTSRAQQFAAHDFARFDWILALDNGHHAQLTRMAPDETARKKIRLLRSFDAGARDLSVPDPYYGGEDGFVEVIDMCEAACAGFLAALATKAKA